METFDGEQGSLPSWLTTAAKTRMRDVARGRPATGHQAVRAHAEPRPAISLDSLEDENEAERVFDLIDTFDFVETAYHKGLVQKAMQALSPRQREYVVLRFFAGLEPSSALPSTVAMRRAYPVLAERGVWNEARRVMAEALA
jgi:DNA-directed RNA polymerase specialized sigma24 family protein